MLKVKAGIRRRLQNLRPAKPGEVRNPKGENGATKRRASFNAIGLDVMGRPIELRSPTGGKMRIAGDEAIWLAMRNKAVKGDVSAAVWVRDTLYGKPMERMQITDDSGPRPIVFVVEGGARRVALDGSAAIVQEGPSGNGHDEPKALEAEKSETPETED